MAKFLDDDPSTYMSLRKRLRPDSTPDAVEAIVFACALPGEAEVIRYNGDASGQPTSAKTLVQDVKLNWNTALVDKAIPASQNMVFLFRNALRACVFYDHNDNNSPFTYDIMNSATGLPTFDFGGTLGGDMVWLNGGYATPSTVYQPHGDYLFPAMCDNHPGYWCDNDGRAGRTTGLKITYTADPGAAGATFQWLNWDGAQWVIAHTADTQAGVLTYAPAGPPLGGAYMTLRVRINNIAAAVFTVQLANTGADRPGIWCHRSVPNMEELLPIIQGIRVNAGSLLWTNFSSDLSKSGKLVSVNVARSLPWTNIAVNQNKLTQLQGYESRQAATGYYGFLKPDGEQDFIMTNDIRAGAFRNTTVNYASFPVDERSCYLAVCFDIANTDARDTSIQIVHSIEYLTNSKIQEVTYSNFTYDQWSQAIQALREIPQHSENKFHFKKLLRSIGRIGKKIFKGVKTVVGLIPHPIAQGISTGMSAVEPIADAGFDAMSNIGAKKKACTCGSD